MMNEGKKTKSLVTIIIFLLITNIAMLIFFVIKSKPAQRRSRNHENRGMYNSLRSEVGFSQDQLTQYENLREGQMKKVHPLFNQVREAKKDFYGLINSPGASDSLVNAYGDSIAQKQKNLDLQMFRYFRNVRQICKPDQTGKFDSLIKKVMVRMIGHPGPARNKPN